jgi:uncharacterized membrane protein (DUF4010 family)
MVVFGSKGIYLTAILGGLVNSTASVAELASTLPAAGLVSLTVPVVGERQEVGGSVGLEA